MFNIVRSKCQLWVLKKEKLFRIDVLMAWDYARAIFRSEKLQIATPKAEISTKTNMILICRRSCMFMHNVCIIGHRPWEV